VVKSLARSFMLLGFGASAVIVGASPAHAQRSDPCLAAPVEGQRLQRAGRLVDARERFAICARNTCPQEIVQDCTRWLRDVEEALPSVVVAARDEQGHDRIDVHVAIDGKPPVDVGARAVSLDPGLHRFVFQRGSVDVEEQALLREGEKNREIVATFASPLPAPPSPPPTPLPAQPERATSVQGWERPIPTSAWLAGAVGVAGLATFGTFAVLGILERASDHCNTGCTSSENDSVLVKFHAADISLVVGVVGLTAATLLYLSRPTVASRSRAMLDVEVDPVPGGGKAVMVGRF
jgi:hypothetical protein